VAVRPRAHVEDEAIDQLNALVLERAALHQLLVLVDGVAVELAGEVEHRHARRL